MVVLSLLLAAAVATMVWFYPRVSLPLTYPGDDKLIARAAADRAKAFNGNPPAALPITYDGPERSRCVEFRTSDRYKGGSYAVCYDPSGKKVSEIQYMG